MVELMNKDLNIIKIISNNLYILKKVCSISPMYVLVTTILSMSSMALPVLTNILIQRALDVTQSTNGYKNFIYMLIIYSVFSMGISVINGFYGTLYSQKKKQDIYEAFYTMIFEKSIEIESRYFDDSSFLNKYSFLINNIMSNSLASLNSFVSLISNIFSIGLLITLISSIDRIIVFVAIGVAIMNFFINISLSKIGYEMSKENISNSRKMGYVIRVFSLREYTKELKNTNIFNALNKLFNDSMVGFKDVIEMYGKKQFLLGLLQTIFRVLYTTFSFIYLVKALIAKTITPGGFAAVFNSFNQLSSSIERTMQVIPDFYQNSLYIDDLREYLNIETKKKSEGITLSEFKSLEFKNVSFKYTENSDYTLKDVSLKIEKGESIAIVGVNGSGKTTITNLMMGLYEATEGKVLLNDCPILEYKKEDLNSIIGIMLQKFCAYAISIEENLHMDSIENVTMSEIINMNEILKNVGIREKIDKLPNKLNTSISYELSPNGTEFSGGELQKIALAKTLGKYYDLLILDEPSSALDSYSEKNIFDNIFKTYKDKSMVLISHKLANIKNVDRIYYISNGKIIEVGNHNELIQLNGEYAKLYKLQAEKYSKEAKM